jgi:hypothetical protein
MRGIAVVAESAEIDSKLTTITTLYLAYWAERFTPGATAG